MAITGKSPNKSAFLRDLFRKDPGVNLKDAEKAWTEAGNDGPISSSSFYNARNELKKGTGTTAAADKPKPKPAPKGPKAKKSTDPGQAAPPEVNGQAPTQASVASSRTPDSSRVFDEVEDGIDDLIFKLKGLGGVPEVQEALRAARRMLGRIEGESSR